MHPKEQHIGLGKQDKADITVEWSNGDRSTFEDIAVNQSYKFSPVDNK